SENARKRKRRNMNDLGSESDGRELNKRILLAVQLHSSSLLRIGEALKRSTAGIGGRKRPGRSTTWPLGESARIKLPYAGSIFLSAQVVGSPPPCVAHKPRVPKRWPLRPRS